MKRCVDATFGKKTFSFTGLLSKRTSVARYVVTAVFGPEGDKKLKTTPL
jgi:hypothetical protein